MKTIKSFHDEPYTFLSNFTYSAITVDGLTYPTVEHYYQAMKSLDRADHERFTTIATPGQAKREGRKVQMRPDWDEVKVDLMRQALRLKFGKQHPKLRVALLETGDAVIEEGNTWNDRVWGIDLKTGEGQNLLGKLLMEIRQEILDRKL